MNAIVGAGSKVGLAIAMIFDMRTIRSLSCNAIRLRRPRISPDRQFTR